MCGRSLVILISLLTAGCAPSVSRGIADDDASFKIPAIKKAIASDDKAAAEQLVVDLENDDPAVRFYAIEGLRRLTGQTFGYRYYDHEAVRRAAVERWKQWLANERDAGK